MSAASEPEPTDADVDLDNLAVTLVQRASLLTRLVFQQAHARVPRSEAGILARLEDGPKRISTLAEGESLAQPTVTLIVKRLEQLQLVSREPDPKDGRATLISLTTSGRGLLTEIRQSYGSFLSQRLSELPADDITALHQAMAAMDDLLAVIQGRSPSAGRPTR